MPTTNINISTDSQTKTRAQRVFAELGLDMTTAINLFLRQTVRENDLPFRLSTDTKPVGGSPVEPPGARPAYGLGSLKGQIWMADDFDAPLEDFSQYMS